MDPEQTQPENEDIKLMRERAKLAPQLQRELAFAKAGIDYESGQGALLFKVYEGELTKDAILAQAAEYKITLGNPEPVAQVESTSSSTTASADEIAALQAIQSATQTSTTGTEADQVHPTTRMMDAFNAAKKTRDGEDAAWSAGLAQLVAAANRGDQRVLVNGRNDAA